MKVERALTAEPPSKQGGHLVNLLGERGEAEVGLDDAEAREELLGLLVLDGWSDNDIVTRDPVDGGGDAVLVASLEGVDNAEDLGGVAASRGRVREDGADGLLGVDEEDGADGEGDTLFVDVGGILVVNPAVVAVSKPFLYYFVPESTRRKSARLTCRRQGQPGAACRQ